MSIFHCQLSIEKGFSLLYLNCLSHFGKPSRFAAGDEHLPGDDLVQHKVLPPGVQLGQNIVQQQHRLLAPLSAHQLPLRQLQADGRRPGLTLRAVGLQVNAGEGHGKVILVGAGETLGGFQLRPIMAA